MPLRDGRNLYCDAVFRAWCREMKRRDFLYALGSAALGWPHVSRAQQADRMWRIGVLMNFLSDGQEGQARVAAFVRHCKNLGGMRAVMFAPTSAGPERMPISIADILRNWLN